MAKAKYKVNNWSEYNKVLVNRGSVTFLSINKRAKYVTIDIRRLKGPVAHLVFDATGFKVFKQGEWKMRQHGKEKRCTWPKLHLGVDGHSHFILCAGLSVEGLGDNQALPSMLRPMRRRIGQIYGDGAYDTKPCYDQIAKKKATPWEGANKSRACSASTDIL